MTTEPISGSAAANTTPVKPTPATGTTLDDLASDFETFLKMMTAQARYQDPLEPMDSSEYASQLAQFSMVEQQVQTNDSLTKMLMMQQTASLFSWVGMDVRAEGPAWFDGAMITVQPDVAEFANAASLVVRNEAGDIVQKLNIPATNEPLQWMGVDSAGSVLPSGHYAFEVESYKDGNLLQTTDIEAYSRVSEVQVDGATHTLILEGGREIDPEQATAMRE